MSKFGELLKSREEMNRLVRQFIKFGFVGVSNTLISLAIYYFLVFMSVHFILANAVAFLISVLNAYYWNNKYVFSKTEKGHFKTLLKTYAAYGFTFLVGTAFLYLMVNHLGISKYIAPLINLCLTIPINFFINRFWAFK